MNRVKSACAFVHHCRELAKKERTSSSGRRSKLLASKASSSEKSCWEGEALCEKLLELDPSREWKVSPEEEKLPEEADDRREEPAAESPIP